MGKHEVINAKERILEMRRRLPHLETIGVVSKDDDNYYLTVGLRRGATEQEKGDIRDAASDVLVEFTLMRSTGFQR
jgi:DNA-binding IclR family transcriptional regulator